MRGSSDHLFGAGACVCNICRWWGDYIVPAVGWRCQHLECSLHDAGMDIELDMELETDSEICTIPKCIYQTISEENAEVKDYTLE